ncbi:hypothetical protein L7F22_029789 [Adiantum nelumboides]|nr:hypothetical protein [Adiantum nelumboides]
MRQNIPLPMSNAGCFGGGSVFQAMIRPSPTLHGFMPDNAYGAMPPGGSNPMYGNIGVQPGFPCAAGSYGMPGTNMGMVGFSQPDALNLNMAGRPSGNFGSGMPLLNAPAYDNLTPKGKPKDYKGDKQSKASKIRKAATFLKTNVLQWWTTLLNQGVVPSTWVQFKQIFAPAWITNTFEVDVMTAWNQLSAINCESLEEYNAKFWDALLLVSSFKMGKPDEDGFKTHRKEPQGKQFSAKGNVTSRLTVPPFKKKPFAGSKAPFEIVEGDKKVQPILQTKDKIFEADKYVQNTDETYRKIKLAFEKTQSKQKKAADRDHRKLVFSLGDWVLLRFERARLRKMKGKECLFPKLGMRYYGPFQVCDKINDVAYRLKLPEGWKIHNAFDVSLLRPFVGDVPEDIVPEEQPEVEELDEILVPE